MAEIYPNYRFNQLQTSNVSLMPVTDTSTAVDTAGRNVISASTNLYPDKYSGMTLLVLHHASAITLNLDAPKQAGIHYHLVHGSVDNTAANLVIKGNAVMKGGIHDLPGSALARLPAAVAPDGVNENQLTIASATQTFDLHFVSDTNDQWIVWGSVVGTTAAAFATAS
jgi:hypothetical protein